MKWNFFSKPDLAILGLKNEKILTSSINFKIVFYYVFFSFLFCDLLIRDNDVDPEIEVTSVNEKTFKYFKTTFIQSLNAFMCCIGKL